MAADESVPNAGAQVGRYVLNRGLAQGALGPLYMAAREVGEGVHYGLARVVLLPEGLPAKDEQLLADAIWDSTHLTHGLVLRVVDVVTGKGWLALVHEHSEGSLIEYLQNISAEIRSPFPAKVASRIALDVIEGLEQSRDHCTGANKPWRPGGVAPGSLLLGPDGRVRALDGQIPATILRVPAMREKPGAATLAAPESFDDGKELTERSDVFSIGALLWELLTSKKLFDGQTSINLGSGFKVPKIAQSVPEGVKVPQGLIHAVHTALEAEPMKRQASLRELAVAIVMGVEEVATHEQVVSFADSLLLDPSSRDDEQPTVLVTALDIPPVTQEEPARATPAVEQAEATSTEASPLNHTPQPAASAAEVPLLDHAPQPAASAAEVPLLDHVPSPTASPAEVPLLDRAPSPAAGLAEVPLLDRAPSPAASPAEVPPLDREPSPSVVPAPARAETEVGSPKKRDKLDTLPGQGSLSQPFRLATDEAFVPLPAQRVHSIDSMPPAQREEPAPKSGAQPPSMRPSASASEIPDAPRRGMLQLSMGTLVLGFSTTVLAVILIMLVLQRSQGGVSKEPHASPTAAASEPAATSRREAASAPVDSVAPSALGNAKQSDAGLATDVIPKADNRKKAAKEKATKSSAPDDAPSDPKGQTPSKHYVPNEL